MASDCIGWDIGGAHLKAVRLDGGGAVLAAVQEPCALWRGLDELDRAAMAVLAGLEAAGACRHAVTMTGELVDAFASRRDGVRAIVAAMARLLGGAGLMVWAGSQGFVAADQLTDERVDAVASANWLASAAYVSRLFPAALFVDMGSTTTDILLVRDGAVHYRGYNDFERLRREELVYSGVVRTPVMAVAGKAPFEGDWVLLAAEHFATMADVYRLTGQLPEHADQWPAADGAAKNEQGSARRLARMLGCDLIAEDLTPWRRLAAYLAESQLNKLHEACLRQLSRGLLDETAPLVGAGAGRFVLRRLAQRLDRVYVDVGDCLGELPEAGGLPVADVAPAAAVAKLARLASP